MNVRRIVAGATALVLSGGLLATAAVPAWSAPVAVVDSGATRTTSDGELQLAWNRVPGATGYLVQVSSSPTFSTIVDSVTTVALRWVPTTPLWGGADARTLYWRVVPQGVGALPDEQSVQSFDRDPAPVPALSQPADGAEVAYPAAVTLSWAAVPGASSYDVSYGLIGAPSATTVSGLQATEYTPASLPAGDYAWSVTARFPLPGFKIGSVNEYPGPPSGTRTFQVRWPSSAPALVSPAAGAVQNDLEFRWSGVPGATSYLVELSKFEDFPASSIVLSSTVAGTTFVPTAVLPSSTYFWRVTPYNVAGTAGEVSETWQVSKRMSFDDDSSVSPGGETALPSFLGVSDVVSAPTVLPFDRFSLSWTPVPRATFYDVVVNRNGRNELRCRTASTTATIVGYSSLTGNSSSSLSNSSTCLWSSQAEDRIEPGEVGNSADLYMATVTAVNMTASGTKAYSQANAQDADVVPSSTSKTHYFYVEEGARTATTTAVEADAFPTDYATTDVSPTLSWAPVEGANAYIVRVYTDAAKSSQVVDLRTTTPTIRSTGVYVLNQTATDGYTAEILPAVLEGTTWRVLAGITPGELTWRRTAPTPAAGSVTDLGGTQLLTMTPTPKTALSGANRGYQVRIFKSGSSSPYATLKVDQPSTVAAKAFTTSAAAFTATPLETGSYEYDWAVLDPAGFAGPYAARVPFSIGARVPTDLRQSITANGLSATLAWSNPVAAASYAVSWKESTATSWTPATTTARGVTISGLVPGKTYTWKVKSKDFAGNLTQDSPEATFTVPQDAVTLVDPQQTLVSSGSATLSWRPVPGASRYVVRLADAAKGVATPVETVETTATSFVPTKALLYGTSYVYDVRAVPETLTSSSTRPVNAVSPTGALSVVTIPGTPTIGTPVQAGAGLSVSWTALTGSAAGSAQSLQYVVRYRPKVAPEADWVELAPTSGVSATLTGLKPATTYQLQVSAQTSEGRGPWSVVKERVTTSAPAAPTSLRLVSKLRAIDVTWYRPTNGGSPLTAMYVRYRPTSSTTWKTVTLGATATSYSITGLAASTRYRVEVFAANAVGNGLIAMAEQLSYGTASAPTSVKAVRGDASATVSWGAPTSTGGASITAYVVQLRSYSASTQRWSAWATKTTATATTRSAKLSSLVNGTRYEARVLARTSVGDGTVSASAAVVPAGKPKAPTSVKATSPKKSAVKVSWSRASANGSAITKYVIQYSTNGSTFRTLKTVTASTTSYTWTKATSKKRYYLRVYAVNGVGNGAVSSRVSVTSK